jgi:bifunctional DNA-binding transcriptional regulator/antitoxin component of YhaV-PrlF toxin-antitoxin module|tara:strand:- start:14 stop:202 length:189 start_codon:yes stop_codon:yes gene_type:complete
MSDVKYIETKKQTHFPIVKVKMDSVSRITIGKELRSILDVNPGDKISIGYNREGDICLEPVE